MLFRRRKLPPELRTALRAAERGEAVARRRSLWRRLDMLLPGALVPSLLIILGLLAWHRGAAPPAPAPATAPSAAAPGSAAPAAAAPSAEAPRAPARAALPRVIYGQASPQAEDNAPPPGRFTARVRVVDGDTLATADERLRLNGIDAPEMGQACERGGATYDCGEASRAAMARIIGAGAVTCEPIGIDQYRRRVVRCADSAGQDVAAMLVAQGWAMAYRQYSMDYVSQEQAARGRGLGLWAGRFEAPWDWRHRQRY